jgi:hypothetical protein
MCPSLNREISFVLLSKISFTPLAGLQLRLEFFLERFTSARRFATPSDIREGVKIFQIPVNRPAVCADKWADEQRH